MQERTLPARRDWETYRCANKCPDHSNFLSISTQYCTLSGLTLFLVDRRRLRRHSPVTVNFIATSFVLISRLAPVHMLGSCSCMFTKCVQYSVLECAALGSCSCMFTKNINVHSTVCWNVWLQEAAHACLPNVHCTVCWNVWPCIYHFSLHVRKKIAFML